MGNDLPVGVGALQIGITTSEIAHAVCIMIILILPDSVLHGFNIVTVFFSAVITVGYVETVVTVLESDRVAQLTVAISMPPEADPIETSFFLFVNTSDGTARGLPWCLEFAHTLL